ncbi:MAG: flotillin family protein [Limisphaerales bacterium]
MIQPFFADIVLISIFSVVGLLFFTAICLFLFIKKIKPGEAGVRTGFGGIKVKKDWMLRVPILQQLQIMDLSVKKLEVVRKSKDGLICEDNIRADIEVVFYVRVNDEKSEVDGKEDYHDIKTVATQVGCERASEIELLKQLFEAKFSEALKSAGKKMQFEKLYTDRIPFRQEIIDTIGSDLNGYTLEDVAIDYLEQTPLEAHDPNNVLDSVGRAKIVELTAEMEEKENQRKVNRDEEINKQNTAKQETINEQNRNMELQIKNKDIETEVAQRELDRTNEQHLAAQTREVEVTKAEESAITEKSVQEARKESENARLVTEEDVEVRTVQKDRSVQEARVNLDKDLLRLEEEKKESGQQAEVDRERRVGLSTQEKEAAIIAAAFGVAESKAGLEAKEKEVTTQHQQRLDVEADMSAERARRVLNIEAEARAEADQKRDLIAAQADYDVRQKKADALKYEDVTKAEADRLEAEQTAEQIQITADAEAKASEKRNHAMQQEAEGTAAMQAAAGYAEANVTKAKAEAKTVDADAEKALGLAEAAVIEAQGKASGTAKAAEGEGEAKGIAAKGTAEGVSIESKGVAEGKSVEAIRLAEAQGAEKMGLAEALAKTEMAKAIELFNKASQDHEEFRLQLDKDKDVELADINIKKDIADAQARVMGEALKSANIDLVGGEQDFFDRVVSSVSQGKVVDRLVDNSQTITDVKNTFFNGDPDHLKNKLAGWIKASGLKSEDVKNLTISALLASMVSKTEDNSLRGLMRAAEKAVRGTEIGSELASTILGDKLGK